MRSLIRKLCNCVKKRVKKIVYTIESFLHKSYGETQRGIVFLSKVVISLLMGYAIADLSVVNSIVPMTALVLALIIYGIITLAIFIGKPLVRPIIKRMKYYHIETVAMGIVFVYLIWILFLSGDSSRTASMIGCIIVFLVECIFARSVWAFVKNKRRNRTVLLTMITTLLLNMIGIVFFFGEGLKDHSREKYLNLGNDSLEQSEEIEYEEKYTVKTISYGDTEKFDLKTGTTNLSEFTSYNDKTAKWVRTKYFGFDIKNVPIAGKIWCPEEGGNYPVLFIIHGNHTFVDPSYMGYEYIGEYLAKCGYVVVSVDESICNAYLDNGMSQENDARAVLLLENIKKILEFNNNPNSQIYHLIDAQKIAIAGHSRGGEAVAIAALFNTYNEYPDNGQVRFNYHFPIQTVFAIAPCCDQYKPANREVILEDVNYFSIHGSNDMDVTEFQGMKQYENVKFTQNSGYRKGYLYIAGANHGQFNTEWGRTDMIYPLANILNTASLINGEDQRTILLDYLKAVLDVTLEKRYVNEDFLRNYSLYRKNLPDTIYVQGYQDSRFEPICNYEEDSVISKGTMPGSKLFGINLVWNEKYTYFTKVGTSYSDRDNYAARLNWNKTFRASYSIDVSDCNLQAMDTLQFDVSDLDDSEVINQKYQPLDFTIRVSYEDGSKEEFLLSDYNTVYPPIPVKLSKLDYLFNKTVYKHQFQTVMLPITNVNKKVEKIQFVFDQKDHGLIWLDNIGFSSK